ncbi:uncharacterized protein B0H64DRAFT_8417 [Chaetomium fimeti]|uniref:Uncharacterized protein n=1 Tax=Chaetomium fimeti TaxID=1854472 RepID=A0AAE0HP55_9PEZI|nr:hypothetical protein B0H64DRAFT_8417 [Chaetomium fimeti]
MERSSRRLTLMVWILEDVGDGTPLTDDAARHFTRPFSPQYGWNATVRRVLGPNSRRDFQVSPTLPLDAAAILKGQQTIHRLLCMILMDVMRSNYRSRPDAPAFCSLIMKMVAALDPRALEGWDSRSSSLNQLKRDLRAFMKLWKSRLDRSPR